MGMDEKPIRDLTNRSVKLLCPQTFFHHCSIHSHLWWRKGRGEASAKVLCFLLYWSFLYLYPGSSKPCGVFATDISLWKLLGRSGFIHIAWLHWKMLKAIPIPTCSLSQSSELNHSLCVSQCCISPLRVCGGLCKPTYETRDPLSSSKLWWCESVWA